MDPRPVTCYVKDQHGYRTWTVGKHGENLLRSLTETFYRKYVAQYLKTDVGERAKIQKYINCMMNMI
jgi:hypothetical protein